MIRVNVATRPFYNERGVHLLLALAALLLAGITAWNVLALRQLSERETVLGSRRATEEQRARELRQEAVKIRASIRQDELDAVLAAAIEANRLIDQRTFSWTALFNALEATLPEDVMLRGVTPRVQDGRFQVTLGIIGRRVAAIDQFMTQLEEHGGFRDVLSQGESAREDGGYEATLIGFYEPGAPSPADTVTQAPAPEKGSAP